MFRIELGNDDIRALKKHGSVKGKALASMAKGFGGTLELTWSPETAEIYGAPELPPAKVEAEARVAPEPEPVGAAPLPPGANTGLKGSVMDWIAQMEPGTQFGTPELRKQFGITTKAANNVMRTLAKDVVKRIGKSGPGQRAKWLKEAPAAAAAAPAPAAVPAPAPEPAAPPKPKKPAPTRLAVLRALKKHEPATLAAFHAEMGCTVGEARGYVASLSKAGLIAQGKSDQLWRMTKWGRQYLRQPTLVIPEGEFARHQDRLEATVEAYGRSVFKSQYTEATKISAKRFSDVVDLSDRLRWVNREAGLIEPVAKAETAAIQKLSRERVIRLLLKGPVSADQLVAQIPGSTRKRVLATLNAAKTAELTEEAGADKWKVTKTGGVLYAHDRSELKLAPGANGRKRLEATAAGMDRPISREEFLNECHARGLKMSPSRFSRIVGESPQLKWFHQPSGQVESVKSNGSSRAPRSTPTPSLNSIASKIGDEALSKVLQAGG